MRIALGGDGEGGADLDAAGAEAEVVLDLLEAVDAAGDDQRDFFPFEAEALEHFEGFFQHAGEIEAGVVDVFLAGGAEVTAGVARVLDDDGVGQAVLLHPALEHDADAARFAENRQQGDVRVVGGHVRQVQRQPCAHGDRLGAGLARLAHIFGVGVDRLHHVDRHHAVAVGQGQRLLDLAVERNQVQTVIVLGTGRMLRFLDQVLVQVTQVDTGDGADRTLPRHGTGQPVGGNTHPHAPLDNGLERMAFQYQRG